MNWLFVVCQLQGLEGFKTAKKGTNVAAQATGLSVGSVFLFVICSGGVEVFGLVSAQKISNLNYFL